MFEFTSELASNLETGAMSLGLIFLQDYAYKNNQKLLLPATLVAISGQIV